MTEKPPALKKKSPLTWIVAGVVILCAIATYFWYSQNANQRLFQSAIDAIDSDEVADAQILLTSLEGLPEFEKHRTLISAGIHVKNGNFIKGVELLESIPETFTFTNVQADALRYKLSGIAKSELRDYDGALTYLEKAYTLDSDDLEVRGKISDIKLNLDPAARVQRGIEALTTGNRDVLSRELKALTENENNRPYYCYLLAILQVENGTFNDALENFAVAVSEPKVRGNALVRAGYVYERLGQLANAEQIFQQAVAVDNSLIDAHRWLAIWYHDQGAVSRASSHLLRISELDKSDPRPHRLLARMSLEYQNFTRAIEDYEISLSRNPAPHVVHEILIEMAQCQVKNREYKNAIETLRRSELDELKMPEQEAERMALLGEAYLAIGETNRAGPLFAQAVKKSPFNLTALRQKGALELLEGKVKMAVATLQVAVEKHPHDYTAQFKLSQAYRRDGNDELADKHDKIGLEIRDRNEKFSRLHEKAEKNPGDISILMELGKTALAMGKKEVAVNWFKAVLQVDNTNPEAIGELKKLMPSPAGTGPMPRDPTQLNPGGALFNRPIGIPKKRQKENDPK